MKRNSKFLLLLAIIMSGIVGVYFIGCEGDDTTIIEPAEEDMVIGSIEGIVTDAFYNQPLPNVKVSWIKKDIRDSVTSDDKGYFLIDDELPSGNYNLTLEVSGYAQLKVLVHIPTFAELLTDIDETAHGPIEHRVTVPLALFPLNAGITGKVYTALPSLAPGKDGETPIAADDSSNLVSPVANVEVILEYGHDIAPNTYQTFTNQDGQYTFTNIPWVPDSVRVLVLPFTVGDSLSLIHI